MDQGTIALENKQRAILLLHSYTNNPHIFFALANRLYDLGYTVYAPLLRGHRTEAMEDILEHSITDFVADGEAGLQWLKKRGYQEIAVIGLSLGGLITMDLLSRHPNLVGGAALNAPLVGDPRDSEIQSGFLKSYRLFMDQRNVPEETIEQRIEEDIIPRLDQRMEEWWEWLQELATRFPHITQPVFLTDSGQDAVIPNYSAKSLLQRLPQSEWVDYHHYPNAPHHVTTGRPGKALAEDLIRFLDMLDWTEDI